MKLTEDDLRNLFDGLPNKGSMQEVMEMIAFIAHSYEIPAVIAEHKDCIHIVLHNDQDMGTMH
jgi:hypothetical protein